MDEDCNQAPQHLRSAAPDPTARFKAIALCAYASDYLRTARKAGSFRSQFRPAQLYLACHALELALKAFLRLHGQAVDSHENPAAKDDLLSLLEAADACGLSELVRPSASEYAQIRRAAAYYSAKVLEYPALAEAMRGYPGGPDANRLMAVTTALVSAIWRKVDVVN